MGNTIKITCADCSKKTLDIYMKDYVARCEKCHKAYLKKLKKKAS